MNKYSKENLEKLFQQWHEKNYGTNDKFDFAIYQEKATMFALWLSKQK